MSEKTQEKTYLTPGEVANILMVSSAAVRRWAADGELKAMTTPGGHRRFLAEHVAEFARNRNMAITKAEKHRLKVLIVDDDKQLSGYLIRMLGKYPEEILPELAGDGFEAGIKIHEFKPDVVLLDLMMPGINGFQVCKILKSSAATKSTRVIAMTGYPSADNTQRIIDAGAEICLPKPLDRNKLLKLLGVKIS